MRRSVPPLRRPKNPVRPHGRLRSRAGMASQRGKIPPPPAFGCGGVGRSTQKAEVAPLAGALASKCVDRDLKRHQRGSSIPIGWRHCWRDPLPISANRRTTRLSIRCCLRVSARAFHRAAVVRRPSAQRFGNPPKQNQPFLAVSRRRPSPRPTCQSAARRGVDRRTSRPLPGPSLASSVLRRALSRCA
jgi:hypothetical protein